MTHRYRFISEHHASYGVTRLCRVLAVRRRQGYYEWLAARPARAQRAEAEDLLAAEIRAVHGEHKGMARRASPRSCAAAAGGSTVSASSGSCASAASSVTPGADAGR
jgi:hypothetical protein